MLGGVFSGVTIIINRLFFYPFTKFVFFKVILVFCSLFPSDTRKSDIMKVLILTVGLPRSGKSTWAKKQGYPIINPDSIRLALHGEHFIEDAEPMVWTIAMYMTKALFLAGHNKIIIDANL